MRLALATLLLLACAGEDEPGRSNIRHGTDAAPSADPDAASPDAALPDASVPDSNAPPQPADRALWMLTYADAWEDGVRARLQPPHDVTGDALQALHEAVPIVVWRGPDSPGAALLETLAPPIGVLHDLSARPDTAEVDAGWLVAHHLESDRALQVEGRPVLLVTTGPREAWAAMRRRLEALPVDPWLVAVIDPQGRAAPPLGATALTPRTAYGHALGGDSVFADAADAAHLARWRRAAIADGLVWLPRAAPPANRRLDDPSAVVEPPLGGRPLETSLVRARRAVDPAWSGVLLDGAGAWQTDRQLDPVAGADTDQPPELTTNVLYRAYGVRRVDAVRAALLAPAGPPPDDLAAHPPLLDLARAEGVLVERLEADATGVHLELVDESGGLGLFETLLDGRPFVIPPGSALHYTRDDPSILVDIGFDRADRLHDVLPRPEGERVTVPLDAFAGRRVEEVTLVYTGGALRVSATLADVALQVR